MRKTLPLLSVLLYLVACAPLAQAQAQPKIPRIGYLNNGRPERSVVPTTAFRQKLKELGYVEGKNIHIEWRHGERKAKRLPLLAAEMVQLGVDVLMVHDPPAIRAAMNATRTIPIVMIVSADPVKLGFVRDLGRPGGNVTGVYSIFGGTIGKRMELLKEVVPSLSSVAVITTPDEPENSEWLEQTRRFSRALDLSVHPLVVRSREEMPGGFEIAARAGVGGIALLKGRAIFTNRSFIADLAMKHRLASIDNNIRFVEAGGLLAYGVDIRDQTAQAAEYVAKILKGAKPEGLPVFQPMELRLGVNLKTARKIGITVPPMVLMEADTIMK